MDKPDKTHQIISVLMKEARHSMDHEHFEAGVIKLQRCLQLEDEPKGKLPILDDLGYCFLKLGWFEEAIKVYTQLLEANPSDNDSRFFLASAYASLKWTGDAIEELRAILATDPNDVLARHDLALCYRNMGWMKESLEEMKIAEANVMIYGNADENEVVKSSLAHLEHEIQNGDEDGNRNVFLLLVLLMMVQKRKNLKARMKVKHRR
jgi:tetratricopeptide (TPR) repeat protein